VANLVRNGRSWERTSTIFPAPCYRGRVLLIGDAVHTATPHMAAGAGIAVEDSVMVENVLAAPSRPG